MNIRRVFFAVAGASLLAGVLPFASGVASAATSPPVARFAAEATSYQNATLAAALANNPSGTRIGPTQVEWNNGTVIMTVPATPNGSASSCPGASFSHPTGWTCVYNNTHFNGTRLQFADAGYYQDLEAYGGLRWNSHSYSNTRPFRSWLNQYTTADHGFSLCMEPNGAAGVIAEPIIFDRWILLTTNSAHC